MFQFYQITFQLPDVVHGQQECLGINKFIWQEKEMVLKGVLGPDENTEYFSQIWREESDFLHEINKKFFYVFETSGVLNDLPRDRILSCSLVKAKESDWPRIRVWLVKFASESVARNTEYETVKLARQMLENGTMFILLSEILKASQWPGLVEKHKKFGDQYGLCSGGTKRKCILQQNSLLK